MLRNHLANTCVSPKTTEDHGRVVPPALEDQCGATGDHKWIACDEGTKVKAMRKTFELCTYLKEGPGWSCLTRTTYTFGSTGRRTIGYRKRKQYEALIGGEKCMYAALFFDNLSSLFNRVQVVYFPPE